METALPQIQQKRVGMKDVRVDSRIVVSQRTGNNQFAQETDARLGAAEGCVVLTMKV